MIPGRRAGTHCVGVVFYPDGSLAEVWDVELSHLSFVPTRRRPESLFIAR